MFKSFHNRDLDDTGSCDEPGAGAPLGTVAQGGTTRESLEEEGVNTIKNIHNEKASRPQALGLGESVNSGAVTRI